MTKLCPALLALICLSIAVNANTLTGHWRGALVRENSTQLLELEIADTGSLTGTYSIPEMGLYDEPLGELAVDSDGVSFKILYGPFQLRRHDDIKQMTGANTRWNPPLAIHLKHTATPIRRYKTEQVEIRNNDLKLAALLVTPITTEPYPALVMVHGSGPQGLDNWEYRSHAYELAQRGVAVLLYDKRGVGASEGDYTTSDFETLASDALEGVTYLKRRPDINPKAIGLMGVSQGGWISVIATRLSTEPNFVVLLQSPAVSVREQELQRVKHCMAADGYSTATIDSALQHTKRFFHFVQTGEGWSEFAGPLQILADRNWSDYIISLTDSSDADIHWWRVNEYDPQNDPQRLKIPTLALFGALDCTVPASENQTLMRQLFEAAGIQYEIDVIDGLPHSVTTYQGLYGGDTWAWPDVFWEWARRPAVMDNLISRWVSQQAN